MVGVFLVVLTPDRHKKRALSLWLARLKNQVAVVRCGRLSLVWGGHHTYKQPTIAKRCAIYALQFFPLTQGGNFALLNAQPPCNRVLQATQGHPKDNQADKIVKQAYTSLVQIKQSQAVCVSLCLNNGRGWGCSLCLNNGWLSPWLTGCRGVPCPTEFPAGNGSRLPTPENSSVQDFLLAYSLMKGGVKNESDTTKRERIRRP